MHIHGRRHAANETSNFENYDGTEVDPFGWYDSDELANCEHKAGGRKEIYK